MKKFSRKIILSFLTCMVLAGSAAAAIDIISVKVIDPTGRERSRFSSTERIGFKIEINNTSQVSRIDYKFEIYGPAGSKLFTHSGNSSPGNPGRGGSTVNNIPLKFYTGPGDYTLKASVVVDGAVKASQRAYFSIYSPTINLIYPADGTRDIIDRPVVFRWVSSGATRYKIEVSESQGFYRPVWSQETVGVSASYPLNPTDVNQKLKGGNIYYWRVTGFDNSSNQLAQSPIFDFSTDSESETEYTRELGVKDIVFNNTSVFPDDVKIDVIVGNMGSQSETDLDVELYVRGRSAGIKKINLISAGREERATFGIGKFLRERAVMTASLDVSDEDLRNNIMTKNIELKLPEEFRGVPKITGRVVDSVTLDNLNKIEVKYSGPQTGSVYTGRGGQFKIEELPLGNYKLTFESEDYKVSEPVNVNITDEKAYPVKNIMLEKKVVEETEKEVKEYSFDEIWEIISGKLPEEKIKEFEKYRLNDISIAPQADINVVIDRIKEGKTGIKNTRIEVK